MIFKYAGHAASFTVERSKVSVKVNTSMYVSVSFDLRESLRFNNARLLKFIFGQW